MTGTMQEQRLLGAVILDPKQYRMVRDTVSADDFFDPRMGDVFAGIGVMLAKGEPVDQVSVMNRWPEWGILGLNSTEVFDWASAETLPYLAIEYAAGVRDDSVRRSLRELTALVTEQTADSSKSPMDVVASAMTFLDEVRESKTGTDLATKYLAEILEETDEYDWVIPGLLERQDRFVLTGVEGLGKTTLSRQIVVASAAGIHPLWNKAIDPVRVLVIDAENTERQWRRQTRRMVSLAKSISGIDPAPRIPVRAGKRLDITKGTDLALIHELVDIHKPDLLYIGPLYKLVPKAIQTDDDAAPLIVALDSLRERGLALLMEAHAGKATGGDGERDLKPRGSSALLGWPEFGMGLRAIEDDEEMAALVRWRGDRETRDWPAHLRHGGKDEFPWVPA